MNSTMATKTTTRSKGPSVLETRTGAIFSEIIVSCWSACAAMRPPLTVGRRASQGRARPNQVSSPGILHPNPYGCLADLGPRCADRAHDVGEPAERVER